MPGRLKAQTVIEADHLPGPRDIEPATDWAIRIPLSCEFHWRAAEDA